MNYQKYADKAYSKIKQYGSAIIITHSEDDKVYNPATDEYESTGSTVLGVAIQRNYNQRDIEGTNIKIGDIQFMASLSGEVFPNDTIEFEGKNYTVINAQPMNVNGKVNIFWIIQAR